MSENDELTPPMVIAMSKDEFEKRFGFRPIDYIDQKFFAVTGKRISDIERNAIESGLIGDF